MLSLFDLLPPGGTWNGTGGAALQGTSKSLSGRPTAALLLWPTLPRHGCWSMCCTHSLQIGSALVHEHSSDIPSQKKKKKQSLPAPCAVPAMRCAVALLQPGACCLDMITCSMLPVVRTCRLSISPYSFVLLAMSQTEIRHKQLPWKKPQLKIPGIGATVTALVDVSGEIKAG